jgi:hypothetical protein
LKRRVFGLITGPSAGRAISDAAAEQDLDLKEQIARINLLVVGGDKFQAEQRKLIADAAKYEGERSLAPVVIPASLGAGFTAGLVSLLSQLIYYRTGGSAFSQVEPLLDPVQPRTLTVHGHLQACIRLIKADQVPADGIQADLDSSYSNREIVNALAEPIDLLIDPPEVSEHQIVRAVVGHVTLLVLP